jgi:hypothetical protein
MNELAVPPHVIAAFPNLAASRREARSPRDARYNCVAWAAGEDSRWWWPDSQGTAYWPTGAPREESLAGYIAAFGTLGYETCTDGALESAYEKLAIFASHGVPTHVTRQLGGGSGTSKLGKSIDLTHRLEALDGEVYGAVVQFMRRVRRSRNE